MKENKPKSQSKIIADTKIGESRTKSKIDKHPLWSSLRLKATLIAVAIGTIPVIAIGIASYQNNKENLNQQIQQGQQSTAEIFADKVSDFLAERYSDIESISEQAIFSDRFLRANTDINEKERFLNLYLSFSRGIYSNIIFLDIEGNSIAIAGERTIENYQKKEYFKEALSGQLSISEPIENTAGETVIVISAPVKDRESGQIIGIVKTSIPIIVIQKIIEDYDKVGHLHLVNESNKIFVTSEEEEPESTSESQHESLDINQVFPELASKLNQSRLAGALITTEESTQEEVLVGYAEIPKPAQFRDLDWYVIVETQAETAFRVESALKETFIVGTLITLAIVTVVASAIANLSIKPIETITAAVRKISQGDLTVRIPVKGKDELADLAAKTNQMADTIEQLIEAEQENTARLSDRNNIVSKLLNLIRNEVLLQGNVQQAATEFTKATASTLKVDRVSIWVYNQTRDLLKCLDRYDRSSGQHDRDEVITATSFPEYFKALAQGKIISPDRKLDNPGIGELIAKKQISPQTTAMLNIPIETGGATVGILRCEVYETARKWTGEEKSFINSLANLLALCLESEYLQNEVEHLLEVVCSMEDGNLNVKAKVSDRVTGLVADTLNRLSEEMTRIIFAVLEVAKEVQQGANQQQELAALLSDNTDRQARGALDVLQLTKQVEQMALDSGRKIKKTNKSLLELGDTVERGQLVLSNLNQDINTLQQGTDRIVQQIKTLGEFVGLADRFVQDQTEIASLTQVLAMNASLVAARAAQQRDPRQFALVAREFESIANQVSSLAQQTNDGLVNLEQRSAQIHKAVSGVDADVQNLGGLVREFTKAVEHSGAIYSNVEKVTAIATESDSAAVESNQAIINAARSTAEVMQDIADLATVTADLTRDTKIQSEAMKNLCQRMLETIEFFQLPELDRAFQLQSDKGSNSGTINSNNNNKDERIDPSTREETSISSSID